METQASNQLQLINHQIKELFGIYRESASRDKLSENEFWIWYALVIMGGDYTQQDICELWSLSKQTVNSIISGMIKMGYITLEMIPGTRNCKRICLTDAGKSYGKALVEPVFAAENRALARIPAADRAHCVMVLNRYTAFLKEELTR